jgi:hypothetical protein
VVSDAARAVRRIGAAGMGFLLVGCYSLVPTGGTVPKPGTEMGFDLTDAGRLALGGSMGPEIDQIEGRLIERDSSEYVVGVTGIRLLHGGDQVWNGEVVHLKTSYVASLYERRFSATRSLALGTAAVGAIAAIATQSLAGLGSVSRPGPSPGDTAHTQRRPR